jgi:uncharacterized protein (DUF362 family)/NAD-dependent dihydropyrimidine dehydrogenase PreA subunit
MSGGGGVARADASRSHSARGARCGSHRIRSRSRTGLKLNISFSSLSMSFRFNIIRCKSGADLKNKLVGHLESYLDIFPKSKSARILLKPNLNSNMNALTGNTTDLRLISAVIYFLQQHGYKNIAIGEGTNSGFYRNRINVITRLMIDKLAEAYGVEIIDLNYAEGVPVELEHGVIAQVAKPCKEADFLINLPKFKTHFEVGMTGCLKNLMGCLVGQENKKKMHQSLVKNIIRLNRQVQPQLHILDGLIGMEGTGPTRGVPVNLGLVMVGTDPYLIDLSCAYIAGFIEVPSSKNQVPTTLRLLHTAETAGMITSEHHKFLSKYPLNDYIHPTKLRPPKVNMLVGFIHHPLRQKYFLKIRQTRFFTAVCSTKLVGELLFKTGLRQDRFLEHELSCDRLYILNPAKCKKDCRKCQEYCPVDLVLPEALKPGASPESNSKCIQCMYCYMVCPERAISFDGESGFFAEQQRQYDEIIRKIT